MHHFSQILWLLFNLLVPNVLLHRHLLLFCLTEDHFLLLAHLAQLPLHLHLRILPHLLLHLHLPIRHRPAQPQPLHRPNTTSPWVRRLHFPHVTFSKSVNDMLWSSLICLELPNYKSINRKLSWDKTANPGHLTCELQTGMIIDHGPTFLCFHFIPPQCNKVSTAQKSKQRRDDSLQLQHGK